MQQRRPEKSGSGGAWKAEPVGPTSRASLMLRESSRRREGGCSTKGPRSHRAGLVGAESRAPGYPGASRLSELARLCF